MRLSSTGWRWAAVAALITATGCDTDVAPIDPGATQATLNVRVDLSGTAIATVVVEVTASDIPAPLVFNLAITNNVASGTVTVPAGSDRTFSVRAHNSSGILTHSGSTVFSVAPGTATLAIALAALTGGVDITVTLGSITVTVTPPSSTLAPAGTVPLSATITDANGGTVLGTIAWATRNPGVASVSTAGVVTAEGPGTTTIWATYMGASGSASITVTP